MSVLTRQGPTCHPPSCSAGFAIGVDVGGTWTRAGLVDLENYATVGPVVVRPTPTRGSVDEVAALVGVVIAELHHQLRPATGSGRSIMAGLSFGLLADPARIPIGVGLPLQARNRIVIAGNNLGDDWIGRSLDDLPARLQPMINDADAVGLLVSRSAPADRLTVVLTFGTGIGSALIVDGALVEATELGLLLNGAQSFDELASGKAVQRDGLSGQDWAARAQPMFDKIERVLNPQRFVVGGGLANSFDDYFGRLRTVAPITPVGRAGEAGVVGAALQHALCAGTGTRTASTHRTHRNGP